MFAFSIFFFACLFIVDRWRRLQQESLVVRYKYRLYALRDELREHVIEGRIQNNNWVFDYLDSSITKACDILKFVHIGRLFVVVLYDRNDARFERAQQHLEQQLKKPECAHLKDVRDKFGEILGEYFCEKHNVLVGGSFFFLRVLRNVVVHVPRFLRKIVRPCNQIKDLFKRSIRELTESPETSTLDIFSPVYTAQ